MSITSMLAQPEVQTGSTYRKALAGKDEYHIQTVEWTLLSAGVRMDIQLGPGKLDQTAAGEMAEGRYPAFAAHNVGLKQGDGFQITASLDSTEVGRSFVVEKCKDFGPRGGWQGEVSETDEDFSNGAS